MTPTKKLVGRNILCVEDEEIISRMYSKGLEAQGASVVSACDGLEGIELLKSHRIDIILLDLEMPKFNGFEMLRVIREVPAFIQLPVIVISNAASLNQEETIQGLKRQGVTDILVKSNTSLSSLVDRISLLV